MNEIKLFEYKRKEIKKVNMNKIYWTEYLIMSQKRVIKKSL